MTILAGFRRKRAIKRYAQELPRQLYSDYGVSTFFTPRQIATVSKKLKLDPDFIIYRYAMFLAKEVFEELTATMPNPPSYEEARAAFVRYDPAATAENPNFYESGLGLFTPEDGGSGGASF